MTYIIGLIILIAIIILIINPFERKQDQFSGRYADYCPEGLKPPFAELIHVEKNLKTEYPFKIKGRPDRVYRIQTEQGWLHVPVEIKQSPHATIFPNYIAELSLQAWVLARNGYPCAKEAYVVIIDPRVENPQNHNDKTAIKVQLLSEQETEQLIVKYFDLKSGKCSAVKQSPYSTKCRSCSHKFRCHGTS